MDRLVAEAAQQLDGLHIPVNSGSHPGGLAHRDRPNRNRRRRVFDRGFQYQICGRAALCARRHPVHEECGWGRIINISGGNARNAGNLSGGARNAGLVHMTKTLAVQLGRDGITVNCIHPGTTRTERTPSLLAARATQLGVSPEEAERRDFAPDSPRGNAICRMVDASEVAFVAVFLASEKAWAVSGELRRGKWRRWAVSLLLSRETGAELGISAGPPRPRRRQRTGPRRSCGIALWRARSGRYRQYGKTSARRSRRSPSYSI